MSGSSSIGQFLARLDVLHRQQVGSAHSKRELYGHVFGTELPAFIIFHAMLGYALLGIGICALALRLPLRFLSAKRFLHRPLGYLWIFGTIWMPVTAIWCVYTYTGWDIIAFFIYSMFAAIQLGWIFVQLLLRGKQNSAAELPASRRLSTRIFMGLHGLCMVYSFIMLLGAGISFPFRANQQFSQEYRDYYASNHQAS